MLSTLVRRSALAAGLALSLLALPSVEAQSFSITKTQGNLVSPNGP